MNTRWRASLAVVFALFAVTVAVYAEVGTHEFVHYDDDRYIVSNPMLQAPLSVPSLRRAFYPYHDNWIPLTWLSLQTDAAAFGIRAPAFLFTNVALHALAAAALFGALFRMTRKLLPSAFCAAVFALHPLHVESVAWAAERKDVLSGLFWALTLYAYARYAERPASIGRYLIVTVSFALGLLAKPMGVTLPFTLLLLDAWPLRRLESAGHFDPETTKRVLLEKLPWVAMSLAVAAVTISVQKESGAMHFGVDLPLGSSLFNAIQSYVAYLEASFWPTQLSIFYPFPRDFSAARVLLCLAILLALTIAALRTARSRPYLLVGWLWFLGTLIPVIGFVQVGMQARADRYMYIPLIGLSIAIAWWGNEWAAPSPARKKAVIAIGAAALFALALTTRSQVAVWTHTATLFEHALAVTRDNHVAHHQLGSQHMREQRIADAERHFREAIRIAPNWSLPEVGLGEALNRQGRTEAAIESYRRSLELDPAHAETRVKLGLVLLGLDRDEEAREALERSLVWFSRNDRRNPAAAIALFGLADILERSGHFAGAIETYRRGLSLAPNQFQGQIRLARALLRSGELEAADLRARASVPGLSSAQAAELARVFDELSAKWTAAGDSGSAYRAARAGLKLARAHGQVELVENFERRIRDLRGP